MKPTIDDQRGFAVPGFLLTPTGIMGMVIVLLSISNLMFFKLWKGAVDDLANYRAAVVQAQKQAENDAAREREDRQRIDRETAAGWAAALDHARRHPVVRVLPARCDLPQAGPVPAAGQKPDEASGQQGLGGGVSVAVEECETRLNNAAQDAAHVIVLQDWIIKQHEASK